MHACMRVRLLNTKSLHYYSCFFLLAPRYLLPNHAPLCLCVYVYVYVCMCMCVCVSIISHIPIHIGPTHVFRKNFFSPLFTVVGFGMKTTSFPVFTYGLKYIGRFDA